MISRGPAQLIAASSVAVALATGSQATASSPYQVEVTCAVGGEQFEHTATASYSTWGSRPDGKPYGSWVFPSPLPECPGNKLVMYREFTPQEVAQLETLIASNDYRALHDETDYFRAQWIEDRLAIELPEPWLLMRATWQTDHDPALRKRYLEAFIARAALVEVDGADLDTLTLRYLLANAYRETRSFDDALLTLETIPLAVLAVEVPDKKEAGWNAYREAKDRLWLARQIAIMRDVIAEGNASREPLRLIPEAMAAYRCKEMIGSGEPGIDEFCYSEQVQAEIAGRASGSGAASEAAAAASDAADAMANIEAAGDWE